MKPSLYLVKPCRKCPTGTRVPDPCGVFGLTGDMCRDCWADAHARAHANREEFTQMCEAGVHPAIANAVLIGRLTGDGE